MAPRPPNARSAPGNPWRSSMTRMELGFGLPLAGAWATPQALVTVARLDVGLGLGWSSDEWQAAGASMERRGARADEFLRVLKVVWTEDPVEFTGEFYRIPLAELTATWRAYVTPRLRPAATPRASPSSAAAPTT
jgi:alkanesulfonate monooxygenase SsuD/methylene tetrahydromethanopterin reductase-like flavin-dependent oxidoreductase (luciferase family)